VSQMLHGGVPLPVVSQRLGHSSVRVTAGIYAHAIHVQDPPKPKNWKGDVQQFTESPACHDAASPLQRPAARRSRSQHS
jgi:hypothetical protein